MKVQKFQEGGLIDEDDLFSDDDAPDGAQTGGDTSETVAGEYVDTGGAPAVDTADPHVVDTGGEPLDHDDPGLDGDEGVDGDEGAPAEPVTLDGVERFLSSYGINGGIIQYEDGSSARFTDLGADEQETVLQSLVSTAAPTIEEKYNLDDDEISLINSFRESGLGDIGEYLNNIVDSRVSSYITQQDSESIDFDSIGDDDLFIAQLRDKHPNFSNEEIADELNKAKELVTYSETIGTIRDAYKLKQEASTSRRKNIEAQEFNYEVEAQREEVVNHIDGIQDIAGAQITDDVKEFLLHDIMELNDNNDPILMEKIFSTPEAMFKTNWFLNYGEDYISNLNDYWKRQVSLAHKKGYQQSINGMPDNPTIIGADTRAQKGKKTDGNPAIKFGETVTEEDLFDD